LSCKACKSDKQATFPSEVVIHFPGLEDLSKGHLFVFPQVLVCLNCGFTEFSIPETELRRLVQDSSGRAA
jgi:hypothetical protein